MASIFRRGQLWWIKYHLLGQRIQHSLHTSLQRVAEAKRREIEYRMSTGGLALPSDTPLPSFLESFCQRLRELRTFKSYKNDLSCLRTFFGPVCPSLQPGRPGPAAKPGEAAAGADEKAKDPLAKRHIVAQRLEQVTSERIAQYISVRVQEDGIAPILLTRVPLAALRRLLVLGRELPPALSAAEDTPVSHCLGSANPFAHVVRCLAIRTFEWSAHLFSPHDAGKGLAYISLWCHCPVAGHERAGRRAEGREPDQVIALILDIVQAAKVPRRQRHAATMRRGTSDNSPPPSDGTAFRPEWPPFPPTPTPPGARPATPGESAPGLPLSEYAHDYSSCTSPHRRADEPRLINLAACHDRRGFLVCLLVSRDLHRKIYKLQPITTAQKSQSEVNKHRTKSFNPTVPPAARRQGALLL